jgi:hypothetical protein
MKRIGIILLDWNGVKVTAECLRSITEVNTTPEFTLDILLIDNGSTIPVKSQLEDQFPNVLYFRSDENIGFAAGNNIGLRYLLENKYDYSLLLNNDTIVNHDLLEVLLKNIESDPLIGVVQPRIHFYHKKNLLWNGGSGFLNFISTPYTYGYGKTLSVEYNNSKNIPWATGCCMMIRNSMFYENKLGLLNEQYQTYFEDVEFSFRVKQKGFLVRYCPDTVVYHHAGYTVNSNASGKEGKTYPFIVYLHSRNRIYLLRQYSKWYFLPVAFFYHLTYYVLLLIRFIFLKRPQKLNATFRGIIHGLTQKLIPVLPYSESNL